MAPKELPRPKPLLTREYCCKWKESLKYLVQARRRRRKVLLSGALPRDTNLTVVPITEASSNDDAAREKRSQIYLINYGLGLAIYILEGLLWLKVVSRTNLKESWLLFGTALLIRSRPVKGVMEYGGDSWLSNSLGKESQFNSEACNHGQYRRRLVIGGPWKKRIGNGNH